MNVLNKNVLVLNRGWSAVNSEGLQKILGMMATDVAVGLDIDGPDMMRPVPWDEWIKLPIRPGDDVIHSARLSIRVPTVVVLSSFSRIPKRRLKLNLKGVAARDGNTCQYSGRKLKKEEMSIDHVLPKSRGGRNNDWRNVVLASKEINAKKGSRTNTEANLKLLKQPKIPLEVVPANYLESTHPDHDYFLSKK